MARVTNLATWLGRADSGAWSYGAEAGAAAPYTQTDFTGKVVLVLGSEGKGLRPSGRRDLRSAGLDPGAGEGRVAQRLRRGCGAPLRGGPPARARIAAASDGPPICNGSAPAPAQVDRTMSVGLDCPRKGELKVELQPAITPRRGRHYREVRAPQVPYQTHWRTSGAVPAQEFAATMPALAGAPADPPS